MSTAAPSYKGHRYPVEIIAHCVWLYHWSVEVELVWSHLKRSLANLAKRNLSQLTGLVKARLKRMQYRPGLLDGFLASTRLDLTPFSNPHN